MDEATLDRNWRLALRVAVASGGLTAALHVFAGVSSIVLVSIAAVTALLIGCRLPAASPRPSLRRLRELIGA